MIKGGKTKKKQPVRKTGWHNATNVGSSCLLLFTKPLVRFFGEESELTLRALKAQSPSIHEPVTELSSSSAGPDPIPPLGQRHQSRAA